MSLILALTYSIKWDSSMTASHAPADIDHRRSGGKYYRLQNNNWSGRAVPPAVPLLMRLRPLFRSQFRKRDPHHHTHTKTAAAAPLSASPSPLSLTSSHSAHTLSQQALFLPLDRRSARQDSLPSHYDSLDGGPDCAACIAILHSSHLLVRTPHTRLLRIRFIVKEKQ